MTDVRVDGRVAIVTGAGNGLGRLYALKLAERGASVVVNDVQRAAAEAVVDEIRAAGGTAVADVNSVATPEGGQSIVDAAVRELGGLDIVVANAGITRRGPFEELSVEDIRSTLAVNLEGSMWVTRAGLPLMKAQGRGRIVLVTSSAATYGHGHGANYCASKGGVVGLLRALAIEGRRDGVRTNAISPFAATGMTIDTPGITPELTELLDPQHVTPVVLFLSSDQCDINGHILSVGAGTVARTFMVTAQGWRADKGELVTAEGVRDNIAQILDPDDPVIPLKVSDELKHLLGTV